MLAPARPQPALPASASLAPWLQETRAIFMLSLPLAASQVAQIATLTIDVIMIGQLGPQPLAASSLGVTLYFFAWVIGFGPMTAVSPIVAQARGANLSDRRTPRAALRMALWTAFGLSIPLGVLLVFAEPLFLALGQPPQTAALAVPYVWALIPSLPLSLGFAATRSFMSACEAPRAQLVIILGSVGLNALLNYMLIYGHFGAPRLELVGAGIATTIANAAALAALLVWASVARRTRRYLIFARFFRPDWAMLGQLFRLGVPMGLTVLFEGTLFQAGVFLMGRFGDTVLAAHQIAINFASVTFMLPLGLALAGTVRVGLAAGRGDRPGARRAGLVTIAMAAGLGVFFGALMWLAPGAIAGLYLPDDDPRTPEVLALATTYLAVAAAFQIFDAVQVAGAQTLRGLKDATVPMVLAGLSYWVVGFPVALVLSVWGGWNGLGVWWGFVAGLGVAAVAMTARFLWLTRGRGP